MFWSKNKKNVYPGKPQFYYIKVGCKGVFVTRACFRDAKGTLGNDKILFQNVYRHRESVDLRIRGMLFVTFGLWVPLHDERTRYVKVSEVLWNSTC